MILFVNVCYNYCYILGVIRLGKGNNKKTTQCNSNQEKNIINNIIIDKQILKDAIIEAYKEIDDENNKKHLPTEALKLPMDIIFFMLTFIPGVLAVVFLITIFYIPITQGWSIQICLMSFLSFLFFLFCIIFCIYFWKTRAEILKEKNKNYIVAYFSAVTSFVALIVALISILK